MADELEELLGFLSSPSPQVKKAALDIVRGLTGSDGGIETLASRSDIALPPLRRLLRDPPDVAAPAAETLINLSQNPNLSEKLVSLGAVNAAMEVIFKQRDNDAKLHKLLVMLLVNLTQLDSGISSLLQVGDDKLEGLYFSKLVRLFCGSSSSDTTEDTYEHVASILVNVSKLEAGRSMLLQPKRSLLKQIIRQSDSTSPLRKKGVSGTIRNCCFEADRQIQNLLMLSEFLWPALLLPVAGKMSYSEEDTAKMPLELANVLSHEREPVDDPEIRKQALEALYLIALQEAGRSALWSVNGPRILQLGYEDEENPKVMEAYELIGSLLVSNAGSEELMDHTIR
ncbi:protein HGH1 homolog [Phalaenopsis equestris]|uniref:protein HGH1 homolog n=1 Tax=Phalaenopsis equestris TaxID=78828 RepID=UPI0009E4A1E5|nr:protein HGH1 homolog [Phalaenopsis equestris]